MRVRQLSRATPGIWYIGALAAPAILGLLFEKQARAFVGEYLYPLYGVLFVSYFTSMVRPALETTFSSGTEPSILTCVPSQKFVGQID